MHAFDLPLSHVWSFVVNAYSFVPIFSIGLTHICTCLSLEEVDPLLQDFLHTQEAILEGHTVEDCAASKDILIVSVGSKKNNIKYCKVVKSARVVSLRMSQSMCDLLSHYIKLLYELFLDIAQV